MLYLSRLSEDIHYLHFVSLVRILITGSLLNNWKNDSLIERPCTYASNEVSDCPATDEYLFSLNRENTSKSLFAAKSGNIRI